MSPKQLESLIRRDPAGRGLLNSQSAAALCRDQLGPAAESVSRGRHIGIVTGFFVPDAEPPAPETDGLGGAVLLADVLRSLGHSPLLITDELCADAMAAGLRAAGCRGLDLLVCPLDGGKASQWRDRFWDDSSALTHLIAIERAGPGYTPEMLRLRHPNGESIVEEFSARVPAASRGRCHNMRGHDIHDTTADLHLLFEDPRSKHIRTIGICDGGNEIGAGQIDWGQLRTAIAGEYGDRIACRTRTDWTILAGVSDWGAFALAAAVCCLSESLTPLKDWTSLRLENLLEGAVTRGHAIDGITRRNEPTVDGLPFITYAQPWLYIRRQLGLDSP